MLTGELKSQIDRIWDTLEENKSARLKRPIEHRIFPEGKDPKKRPYEDLRWSRFKHFAPAEMFNVVDQHVFPFLRVSRDSGMSCQTFIALGRRIATTTSDTYVTVSPGRTALRRMAADGSAPPHGTHS